jgi:nonribosomal peptide synthetase DhbF
LARGYLDRPDLTAASFLPDPYSAEAGMRLYRLGDVARWRTDGTLEYLGRADRQVKVRGVRVEPEEVEAVLRQHPAVRAAAVVARPDPAGELELVAFLETADGAEPVVKEIEQHCAGHLPAAMTPAAFVSLPALPRSAHGKIDRQVLCNWQFARGPRLGRHRLPRGDTEKRLAELLSQLLEVAPVGAEDRFVDLGGHSVSAIRLTSRIKREFGVDLPLRLVFTLQTVAAIAAELDSRRGAAVAPAIAVAERRGRRMRRSALGAEG